MVQAEKITDRLEAAPTTSCPPRRSAALGTCWRRLRGWTEACVWPALHGLLLAELRATGKLDLDRCAVDGSPHPAIKR